MAINDIRPKAANPANHAEMEAWIRSINGTLKRLQGMTTDLAPTDTFGDMATASRTSVAITGGTVNGASMGATTPAAGTFTNLKATSQFGLGTLASQQASIADAETAHAITDPADTPADADALRDDLVLNTIPSIEAALNNLGAKVNALIARLETFGLIVTV